MYTGPEELRKDQEAYGPHAGSSEANHIPHPSTAGEINKPGRGKPRSQKGTTCPQSSASAQRLAAPCCMLHAELAGEWSLKVNRGR